MGKVDPVAAPPASASWWTQPMSRAEWRRVVAEKQAELQRSPTAQKMGTAWQEEHK